MKVGFNILPNGNLELTADEEERNEIRDEIAKYGSDHAMATFIQPFAANGRLYCVEPEWIAALTSAPILTDDLTFNEDGPEATVNGRIWWFPNYQIIDPMKELVDNGRVEFDKAPESK